MAFEAHDLAVVPQHALAGIDHADRLALGFQQRALLDMQFDEAAQRLRADGIRAAIADGVERRGDADPGGVRARQNVVGGEMPGIGGRAHHRRGEARAFLIGPVHQAERRLGLDPGVVERTQHFERRQRAEHAVELAAGRLGVEMRAEADRGFADVAARAQREHVAERIDADLAAGRSQAARNQSRTCLSSALSVSRRTPPFAVAPNFAVSWIVLHSLTGSICRLEAGLRMQTMSGLEEAGLERRAGVLNGAPASRRQWIGSGTICCATVAVEGAG